MPGRVLVVFFFGSTVFLTFFRRLPAGCRSPCSVYAFVGLAVLSVCSFLFFGALPHTRLRVSLLFVSLFGLLCPLCAIHNLARRARLYFVSRLFLHVFPPAGCCPVWLASLLFVRVYFSVRCPVWLVSRYIHSVCFLRGGCPVWLASHPLLRICPLLTSCPACLVWLVRRVPLSFSVVFCWCTLCCYLLVFVHFFLIIPQSNCVVVYAIVY